MNSVADVWQNVLLQLKRDLSETTISTWFDELQPVDIRDGVFLLYCPNDFKKGYIESLFLKNIKSALRDIFSMDMDVQIMDTAARDTFLAGEPKRRPDHFTYAEFTFDTFVVGPSNKLAYAAAVAVAENPARNYNPLLIYGDSGLGKTHLLYSIANVIRKNSPQAKIAYVKGDDFTNELVESIQEGPKKTAEMREKYRQADLLMVDDIQFIAGKKQTQEEFFHTFNTLYESGRQIVLTSDRPPSEMTLLDDRLRTRFEWGLLVDVIPPDFETRVAIVKNKSALLGMEIPDRVAFTIAEKVTANVRQLEGIVNKLLAYKELLDDSIDQATVERAMQDILKHSEYIPSPQDIVDYIGKYYQIDPEIVRGQQRVREAVSARQIAMYLIRNITNLSLDDIGKFFSDRDHSTVVYSIQQVEKKMRGDRVFAETVKEIKSNINEKHP